MKTLIYATCGFADPNLAILLDVADQAHAAGDDVVFAHCAGHTKMCFENPSGNPALCLLCRHCVNRYVKQRREWLRFLSFLEKDGGGKSDFVFTSVSDLKQIEYRGCRIGYGVLSTYISLTRDCFPDFSNHRLKKYFCDLLSEAAKVTDRAYRCIELEKPDKIVIYNGRLFENRSFHEVAKIFGIPFESNEVVGGFRTGERFKRIVYPNVLPHDVEYNTELIAKLWAMPNESVEEKIRKGADFYERRRRGVVAGDRVYIAGQTKGLLPSDWNPNKRNFVIFNSSEDEFAAIGPEFEKFALFPSQLDGIRYMLEHVTDSNIHFYLRVHPNLTRVHFAYRDDLLKLPSQYKNITVVDANDPSSTYDMMDAAEKVIVFGSTTGAEAVYWGKPVILLAASFYHELGMTYNPSSKEELLAFLNQYLPILQSGRNKAIKFGYFLLNRYVIGCDIENFDVRIKAVQMHRKRLPICGYNTFCGSIWLMKFLRVFLKHYCKRGRLQLPIALFADPAFIKV